MSNVPTGRVLVGSAHVDCMFFVILAPVRNADGPVVHFVPRDRVEDGAPSFCGAVPTPSARGVKMWRRVAKPSSNVCNTCHAGACAKPSRIGWCW